MNYIINKDSGSISDRICAINKIDRNRLDVSDFVVDYDQKALNDFKEKLLSDKDKRFFIVGDYDCDGICATTIIKRLFNHLGIESNYYIPSRSKEGYGLNKDIVDVALNNGFGAIICVDNGVVAYEQMKYAKDNGLQTYVIDHHEYTTQIDVDGFLHPDLLDDDYHDMCGAGLCQFLASSFYQDNTNNVYGGLATLADMVSVLGYNRYLLKQMIEILNKEDIIPIRYLLEGNDVSYESLSFNVIPKINAVSRLEDMLNVNYVVRYLLSDDDCLKYLNKIEEINRTRKDLTRDMSSLAMRLVNKDDDFIVVKSAVFKEGICGLIANRLMNTFNKPVLVLSETDEVLKGSGRSPANFDLYSFLYEGKDIFNAYGGHAQAVGVSLNMDRYDELKDYIHSHEVRYEDEGKDVLYIDIDELSEDVIREIENLSPYGTGFNKPFICIDGKYDKKIIIKGQYPKFVINDDIDAISFNSEFIDKDFTMMIGQLKRDNYHKNKLSFLIEDLI